MRYLKIAAITAACTIGFAATPAIASTAIMMGSSAAEQSDGESNTPEKRKGVTAKPTRKSKGRKARCRTCRILM